MDEEHGYERRCIEIYPGFKTQVLANPMFPVIRDYTDAERQQWEQAVESDDHAEMVRIVSVDRGIK